MTINGARGTNSKIKDRFDLTLECIRLYYLNKPSPLSDTFERYSSFFNLFQSFNGYVEYFLLQDLVSNDLSSVEFFIPFNSFEESPLPCNVDEYRVYRNNTIKFIISRNQRHFRIFQ